MGAASGIGARDTGCEDGPVAFHHSRAWRELEHHPALDWDRTLFPVGDRSLSVTNRVAGLCRHLADEVALTLASGQFPVVVGGDHSVAIGTWSGVARHVAAPVGLLWIDAHMDSHTPETTYSGAIHGMPLACLLGQGDKRLLDIGLTGGQLIPAHTVVFGARSFEPEEAEFLERMRVRVFGEEEIERDGFRAAFDAALAIVRGAPNGFGISIDLDAIDPSIAPGVGSPEPDGLTAADVLAGLDELADNENLLCLEIVEYNPDRDRHGITAKLIGGLIKEILPAGSKAR
ncbi:MAG TPA: arginase [Parasulfuritortus sp.]